MTVEDRTITLINTLSNYAMFLNRDNIEKWVGISQYIDTGRSISELQYACLKKLYDICCEHMPECKVLEAPRL